jgi:hypothetical protein
MATLDEAQKCPQCGFTGDIRVTQNVPAKYGVEPGSKLLTIFCMNERCEWFETPWNVSVRPDGSIPDPQEHRGEKQYLGFEHHDEEAQRLINQLVEMDEQSKTGRIDPFTQGRR